MLQELEAHGFDVPPQSMADSPEMVCRKTKDELRSTEALEKEIHRCRDLMKKCGATHIEHDLDWNRTLTDGSVEVFGTARKWRSSQPLPASDFPDRFRFCLTDHIDCRSRE